MGLIKPIKKGITPNNALGYSIDSGMTQNLSSNEIGHHFIAVMCIFDTSSYNYKTNIYYVNDGTMITLRHDSEELIFTIDSGSTFTNNSSNDGYIYIINNV